MPWRPLLLVLLVLVAATAGWLVFAAQRLPSTVERVTKDAASRADVTDAERLANELPAALAAEGLTVTAVVVTVSATEPFREGDRAGVLRSVSARVEGTRPLFPGIGAWPFTVDVQLHARVPDGLPRPASHWPASAAPLALRPLPVREVPVVAESEFTWSSPSHDRSVTLVSAELGRGCELRCEQPDGGVSWRTVAPCRIRGDTLRFVGPGCERTVVLDPSPITATHWETTVVATVLARADVEYEVNAVTVVSDIKTVRNAHGWLRGRSDVQGAPPEVSADGGAVEFVTADGRAHAIPLHRQ